MRLRRWVAAHRKLLAIALLGLVELAAYVLADPGELPDWVVTAAVAVNALGVYLAPRNATPVSRDDLKRTVGPTRFAGPEDRRGFGGGP
jgi:type IV secretory pathway protease TraF